MYLQSAYIDSKHLHNIYKNQITDIQNRSKNYHNSYKYEIFLINNKYKKLHLKHILLHE